MLNSYYYLISSLPFIDLTSEIEYTVSDFFNNVEVSLSKEEFKFLKSLLTFKTGNRGKSKVFDLFLDFDETIKYTLAYLRSENLGWISKNVYLESPYFSSYYLGILKNICSKMNPFEVELGLDMLKWQFLTDLEVGHVFDLERLIIYFLKLKIFSRYNLFKEKLGFQNFDNICQNLIERIDKKDRRGN